MKDNTHSVGITCIWNHKLQSKEYIVDLFGEEIYRSVYLDECEGFCEEHGFDWEFVNMS